MRYVIDSVAGNSNRYGAPHVLVICRDEPSGPAHQQDRLVLSGNLDLLCTYIGDLQPGRILELSLVDEVTG